jgi:hypothetical protein
MSNIHHPQAHQITASKLTVNGEIKQGKGPDPVLDLQVGLTDIFWPTGLTAPDSRRYHTTIYLYHGNNRK